MFSLFDFAVNWYFPECLILVHSGLLRETIIKSRR
jgi:hypothetical protein